VRLYLGRDETSGRSSVDILEAFKAACFDEEDFREQLRRYAYMVDGRPQVTPDRIPPLVRQQLPWLKPTANNKMYNAELVGMFSPGSAYEPKMYPSGAAARSQNLKLWEPLLAAADETSTVVKMPSSRVLTVKLATMGHAECLRLFTELEWQDGGTQFEPYLQGLEEAIDGPDAIEDWLVLFPQIKGRLSVSARLLGHGPFTLNTRSDLGKEEARGSIASAGDRKDIEKLMVLASLGELDGSTLDVGARRGVILAYPMVHDKHAAGIRIPGTDEVNPAQVVIGTTLVSPLTSNGGKHEVRFRAKSAGNGAIVDRR
jgi:hypothetical protein